VGKRRAKRDHYTYVLKDGRRVVKHGITINPDRRLNEMENQSPRFTSMSVDPVPVSKETALKREKEHVERYQRNHRGRKPRYNKRP